MSVIAFLIIVVEAGVILVPNFPLVNKKRVMHEWTNPRPTTWWRVSAVVLMIGLTLALVAISVRGI